MIRNKNDSNLNISYIYQGNAYISLLLVTLLLNIFFLFVRPQEFPFFSLLGTVRIPLLLGCLVSILTIPILGVRITLEIVLVIIFLFFQVFRAGLGYFADPYDTIIRNDRWHFNTLTDLCFQFFSVVLPLIICTFYSRNRRISIAVFSLIGVSLSLYCITHDGRGPGGFVGDENDLCSVLVLFLPFCFLSFGVAKRWLVKLFWLIASTSMILAVVITQSRGGFLALIAALFYLFLKSPNKIKWVAVGFVGALALFFVAPSEYWGELRSIPREYSVGTGTIQARIEMWKVAINTWKDPRNILFGIGLANTPYWIAEYQPPEQLFSKPSLGGRVVHSLYLQALLETGIIGFLLLGVVISLCMLRNEKIGSELMKVVAKDSYQSGSAQLSNFLEEEIRITEKTIVATNGAWFGVLTAGIGISILYYPLIWLLVGFSVALQLYGKALLAELKEKKCLV